MKLLIAGGGTGGHLFPGIAVAEEFTALKESNEVLFIGTKNGLEGKILPEYEWPVSFVTAEGIKGKGFFKTVKGLSKMLLGSLQSIGIIHRFRPSAVLGVGGYAAVPAVIAGKLLGISSAIHEQNAMPGLSNRLLGRLVNKVFLTYPESERFFPAEKVRVTGNPVRKSILKSFDERKKSVDSGKKFTLFIFGGSQGARRINDVLMEIFFNSELAGIENLRVIHQTGDADFESVKKCYEEMNIEADVYPFIKDMASIYLEADLIICRAGATTIAELLAAGKPSILIPYPYAADDHQRLNGEALVKEGAAMMILENDMTSERLSGEIRRLVDDRKLLAEMSEKTVALARPDAAARICEEMSNLAGRFD